MALLARSRGCRPDDVRACTYFRAAPRVAGPATRSGWATWGAVGPRVDGTNLSERRWGLGLGVRKCVPAGQSNSKKQHYCDFQYVLLLHGRLHRWGKLCCVYGEGGQRSRWLPRLERRQEHQLRCPLWPPRRGRGQERVGRGHRQG